MALRSLAAAIAAASALAACVPPTAPRAPQPAPAPQPQPQPPPPAPAAPPPAWEDGPLSEGDWSYRREGETPTAAYSSDPGAPAIVIRCGQGRSIDIAVAGAQGSSIIVRTTFGERRLAANPDGLQIHARLAATDPLLDQIAFSRGRFLVQAEGAPPVVVPAWPEPARVIEDCRP